MNDDEDALLHEDMFHVLSEEREISCGALNVMVDFNDLLVGRTEEEAFELVAKLKDLLS